jgi:hypothetical protein
MTSPIIIALRQSRDPTLRFKALTLVLGKRPDAGAARQAQQIIRTSTRVRLPLSERQTNGRLPHHPYTEWYGAHWVLATLADIGYPPGGQCPGRPRAQTGRPAHLRDEDSEQSWPAKYGREGA